MEKRNKEDNRRKSKYTNERPRCPHDLYAWFDQLYTIYNVINYHVIKKTETNRKLSAYVGNTCRSGHL